MPDPKGLRGTNIIEEIQEKLDNHINNYSDSITDIAKVSIEIKERLGSLEENYKDCKECEKSVGLQVMKYVNKNIEKIQSLEDLQKKNTDFLSKVGNRVAVIGKKQKAAEPSENCFISEGHCKSCNERFGCKWRKEGMNY